MGTPGRQTGGGFRRAHTRRRCCRYGSPWPVDRRRPLDSATRGATARHPSAGSRCSGPPRPGTPGRPGRRAPSGVRPARRRAAGPPDGQGSSRSAVCGAVTRPPSAHRRRAGQVDAEVGGEHEGEAAVPLSVRFLLVGGDAGADEAGGGAVEGEVTAVRGVVLREADGGRGRWGWGCSGLGGVGRLHGGFRWPRRSSANGGSSSPCAARGRSSWSGRPPPEMTSPPADEPGGGVPGAP